jgi:hypothetical protein
MAIGGKILRSFLPQDDNEEVGWCIAPLEHRQNGGYHLKIRPVTLMRSRRVFTEGLRERSFGRSSLRMTM